MVAAKMANLKNGENIASALKKTEPRHEDVAQDPAPVSNDMAAEALEVSKSSVDRAKRVLKSGDQDLIDAVEQGEMAVNVAV